MGRTAKGTVIALSVLVGMFAVSTISAAPVSAIPSQTLYGCDGSDSSGPATFYTINPSNGVVTLIGSMVNDYGCSAMDFSPGGTLYATGSDSNGIVSLFTVNTLTGYATWVGYSDQGTCGSGLIYPGPPAPLGTLISAHNISDISFSTGGTLYALFVTFGAGGTGSPCLGTLNTGTGAETDVGTPPTGMTQAGDGMATSASNVHYGADPFNLYTISTSTGKATVLAAFSGGVNGDGLCSTTGIPPGEYPQLPNGFPPAQPVDAMKFNNGGVLYAVINCGRGFVTGDSFLATIATSGAITVIHETEDATGASLGMDGIAWGSVASGVPQFPLGSAGSLALVAAALPILWMLRGRHATRLPQ